MSPQNNNLKLLQFVNLYRPTKILTKMAHEFEKQMHSYIDICTLLTCNKLKIIKTEFSKQIDLALIVSINKLMSATTFMSTKLKLYKKTKAKRSLQDQQIINFPKRKWFCQPNYQTGIITQPWNMKTNFFSILKLQNFSQSTLKLHNYYNTNPIQRIWHFINKLSLTSVSAWVLQFQETSFFHPTSKRS